MTDETGSVPSVHWSFWVISVFGLIYNAMGGINFVSQMDAANLAAFPEGYRAIIEGRPLWATAAFAIAVFGGALGCLALLLRHSAAFYVLIISLLGAVVTMVHTLSVAPFEFVIGNLVQLVVTVLLIWYARYAQGRNWIS
jgi:hypothetical protein